jgi:hypothetical protein
MVLTNATRTYTAKGQMRIANVHQSIVDAASTEPHLLNVLLLNALVIRKQVQCQREWIFVNPAEYFIVIIE